MNNRGAITRFCASALCIALFLTYISVKGLSYTDENPIPQTEISATHIDNSKQNDSVPLQTQSKVENSTTSKNDTSKRVMISASGTAQGKVIEKFISPYTANTSYENIYLKNNTSLDINLKDFMDGNLDFKIKKAVNHRY